MQVTWYFDFDYRKFINCMMWDGKKTLSQRLFKEVCTFNFYGTTDSRSILLLCFQLL